MTQVEGDLQLLVERLTALVAQMRTPGYCSQYEAFVVQAVACQIEFCLYGGISGITPVKPAVTKGPDGTDHQASYERWSEMYQAYESVLRT